jgi:hypothetical protein
MAFKMNGFSGFKQKDEKKNVKVKPGSVRMTEDMDNPEVFTGIDSKGREADYATRDYGSEINAATDSVGVQGSSIDVGAMERSMIKDEGELRRFDAYQRLRDKEKEAEQKKKSPAKQTSHGPIKEYKIPNNPNEGPYIVRGRPTGQTVEPKNEPDYKHIRERHHKTLPWNPGQGGHDGPHPERPKQLRNYDAMKKAGEAAAKAAGEMIGKSMSPAKQVARVEKPVKPTRK